MARLAEVPRSAKLRLGPLVLCFFMRLSWSVCDMFPYVFATVENVFVREVLPLLCLFHTKKKNGNTNARLITKPDSLITHNNSNSGAYNDEKNKNWKRNTESKLSADYLETR